MLRIQLLWLSEAIIHLNTVVEQTGGDMKNKKDKEGKKKKKKGNMKLEELMMDAGRDDRKN